MVTIQGNIRQTHYQMTLSNGRRELTADEPSEHGGTDRGFAPTELLCGGLAACTCATLRMYADRKGWDLAEIQVHISFTENAASKSSDIKREIALHGGLSAEQRQRLLYIANQCPVHKILTNPIGIETVLAS